MKFLVFENNRISYYLMDAFECVTSRVWVWKTWSFSLFEVLKQNIIFCKDNVWCIFYLFIHICSIWHERKILLKIWEILSGIPRLSVDFSIVSCILCADFSSASCIPYVDFSINGRVVSVNRNKFVVMPVFIMCKWQYIYMCIFTLDLDVCF